MSWLDELRPVRARHRLGAAGRRACLGVAMAAVAIAACGGQSGRRTTAKPTTASADQAWADHLVLRESDAPSEWHGRREVPPLKARIMLRQVQQCLGVGQRALASAEGGFGTADLSRGRIELAAAIAPSLAAYRQDAAAVTADHLVACAQPVVAAITVPDAPRGTEVRPLSGQRFGDYTVRTRICHAESIGCTDFVFMGHDRAEVAAAFFAASPEPFDDAIETSVIETLGRKVVSLTPAQALADETRAAGADRRLGLGATEAEFAAALGPGTPFDESAQPSLDAAHMTGRTYYHCDPGEERPALWIVTFDAVHRRAMGFRHEVCVDEPLPPDQLARDARSYLPSDARQVGAAAVDPETPDVTVTTYTSRSLPSRLDDIRTVDCHTRRPLSARTMKLSLDHDGRAWSLDVSACLGQ